MAGKAGIRLSFAPLEAQLIAREIDVAELPSRLQVAIRQGRMKGHFTLAMADEIACDVLGMHPLFIWGHEYEANAWHDMDPDPAPIAQVIVLPVAHVVEVKTRVLVAA